jgi:hypothetical protein
VIRSYEEEIRKARQARDFGISEEERRISKARSSLEDIGRVRDFFELPRDEDDYSTTRELAGEEAMERADEDDTEILRRPGPLSEDYWDSGENRGR